MTNLLRHLREQSGDALRIMHSHLDHILMPARAVQTCKSKEHQRERGKERNREGGRQGERERDCKHSNKFLEFGKLTFTSKATRLYTNKDAN